ncbi:MAG: hypothetical protein IPL11_03760 [Candidatus Accumulibacter sp.]|nr:hypothetical protein [Accumulibacter sp.]
MATRRLGTDGADTLSAVDAGDTLAGGDGDDYYFVHSMLDVVEEVGQYYDFEQDLYLSGGIDTVSTDVLDRLRTYSIAQLYGVENLSFHRRRGSHAARQRRAQCNQSQRCQLDERHPGGWWGQ